MARHELPLDASVLHGHFSRELEPVLTVEPGDSVRFSTPNAGWDVGRGEPFASRNPELDTGHALAGPIEVRGARAGQTLAVRIDEVRAGAWGITFGGADYRLDWELDGEVGRALGRTVRLAPFLGVLGMPPAEPGAIRRSRRGRAAGTSTARSSSPARRCSCRFRSTARSSRPATGTRPGRRRGLRHGDRGARRGAGDARRARRPRARVAGRPDRRRLADVRLRRAPRARRPDRGRRDARR